MSSSLQQYAPCNVVYSNISCLRTRAEKRMNGGREKRSEKKIRAHQNSKIFLKFVDRFLARNIYRGCIARRLWMLSVSL